MLDGCISFDPLTRIQLASIDLQSPEEKVVVAPERRKHPFLAAMSWVKELRRNLAGR